MSENFLNFINKEKANQPSNLNTFKITDEPIEEDVKTIVSGLELGGFEKKPRVNIIDNKPKLKRKLSNLSDILDLGDEEYMRKRNESNIFFNDDKERIKYEYERMFDRYRKKNFSIPKLNPEDSIEKYKMTYDDLMWRIDKNNKFEIFSTFLWATSWIVEKISKLVGKNFALDEWNNHVWKTREEFRPYFEKMIRPRYERDPFTDKIVRKENNSIINKINFPTEVEVIFALGRSAVTFGALRNLKKITEYINKIDNQNEEIEKESEINIDEIGNINNHV
jgi:hypothetical protein